MEEITGVFAQLAAAGLHQQTSSHHTTNSFFSPTNGVFYRKKNNNALWGHFCNAGLWENIKNAYRKYLY